MEGFRVTEEQTETTQQHHLFDSYSRAPDSRFWKTSFLLLTSML